MTNFVLPQLLTWPPIKMNGIQIISMSNLSLTLWNLLPRQVTRLTLSCPSCQLHRINRPLFETKSSQILIVLWAKDSHALSCGLKRVVTQSSIRPNLMKQVLNTPRLIHLQNFSQMIKRQTLKSQATSLLAFHLAILLWKMTSWT